MRKDQHVIPVKNGWAVKTEGEESYSSIHKTQQEAIDAARKTAKKEKSEIVIHRKTGQQGQPDFMSKPET